jgi:superfamily II DNA or RNA helicase
VYNVNYPELFELGSILEPRYISTGRDQLDLTKLKKKGPDFDFSRFGSDSQPGFSTLKAMQSAMVLCDDRRSVMVFAASVAHAELIVDILRYHEETAELVSSKTKKRDRAEIVDRFKNYETKYLVNVATLLVGFDHRGVDAIADLAPSMSPSRVEQKYGRCVRYLEGKPRPIILDYAGNCHRHGLLGSIKPASEKKKVEESIELSEVVICESCGEMSPRGSKLCDCGVELEEPELRDLNSGKLYRWLDGKSARYFLHDLKNGGQAIKIQFIEGSRTIETFLLFEHKFMKHKANELASQIFGYDTIFANSFECYPFILGQRFKRALVELSRFPKIQRIEKE